MPATKQPLVACGKLIWNDLSSGGDQVEVEVSQSSASGQQPG
jgi:hypothetical protein